MCDCGGFRATHCTFFFLYSYRKTISVKINDDEEYEKQEHFFIVLGEPKWMKRGISGVRSWDVTAFFEKIYYFSSCIPALTLFRSSTPRAFFVSLPDQCALSFLNLVYDLYLSPMLRKLWAGPRHSEAMHMSSFSCNQLNPLAILFINFFFRKNKI